MERQHTGRIGEARVASYLREKGYVIRGSNVRVGRLELDIIAQRGRVLAVCEVRTKSTTFLDREWWFPEAKRERVRRAAVEYWRVHAPHLSLRVDAAIVVLRGGEQLVEYYEDAFRYDA